MKSNRSVVTIILVFMLLLTNSNIALAQSIPEVELVEQSDPAVVQVVRVYYESMEDIELLVPFDLFEYNNLDEKYVLVAVNAWELGEIKDLGFKVVIDEEETAKFNFLPSSGENQLDTIPSFPCYRTVEETYAAAAALATNYPNLATWIDVGESWQKAIGPLPGYDMMVLKLTNQAVTGDKPVFFITASIHAREYAPAEIATRFAEYLVNNYGIDPDVTWMLDYQEVHIMFHANPDGRKIAETGSSWRKNRDNDDGCSTTYGVDLNRNFTYQWGTGGSSTNPCDETYRGPSAGSEPETQAIQAYISSVFIDQRGTGAAPADAQGVYIDIHSSGGYVMWPWGYTTTTPPNNTQLQTMGRKLAYFNGYTPGQITRVLYVASGGSVDYAYGEMGVATYAFEVGTAFFQACSSFESTVYPTNLNALLYAAKVTRTPYMTPLGPDSLNLALSANTVPAGASVTLTGLANDTRYKSGTGEATQAIAAAEYYIDTPPWVTGATAFPMSASDGTFNSTSENITATVNTTGWTQGRHTLFLRSQDAAGNWGAVSAVFLTVIVTDNEPPVADDQEISTLEDTAVSIVLSGSDPDDNPLTFSIVDGPTSGSLSGTAPDLTYTPAADYNGLDSFTYKANDGFADSELATVSITINPVNDAPVAQNQSVSTEVNVPVAIELAGLDVDGDSLTFTVLTDPEYGSLSGTAPNLQYTPITGYTGSDSFTYSVSDGELYSEIATISITITPPGPVQIFWDDFESDLGWVVNPYNNDAATTGVWERANPEGTDSSGSVMQLGETISGTNNLVTGALAGSSVGSYDIDGGDTTILSPEITLPGGRELTLSFYYYLAHLNNATADDYLRVSVLGETSQLVFEELGAANTDIATWESYSADISSFSGQTIRLLIEAADSGTASLVEAAIDDVLIQGLMTNNPPVADSQSVVTEEDMAVGVTLSGSDPDGSPLTYTLVTQPLHGNLSGTAPDLTYTPAANFNGSDSFTFKVNDGETDSNIATVSISVTPVNDAPIANGQSVSTEEDTAKGIVLTGTDVDGNPLTYTIVTQPMQGNLSGDAPNVTYTPAANYNGTDSFTFKVNDGSVDSDIAMVTITVSAVNDAPIADSQSVNMAEDTTTAITLTGSDVESSQLIYYIVTSPAHGTLSGTAPDLTYTPAANYNGSDSFTFKANDGQTDSAPATVSITITPVNDAPIATPQNIGTTQDTAVSITLSGSDIDGDTLTYAVSAPPTHGTLSGTVPNLTFTPNSGYVGADSFEFTVNDGSVTSSPATISISISNINDAPVADGQTLSTPEDTSLSITLSGSDVDNDPLTYRVITEPAHGTLTGDEPALTYMPAENYHGTDSFTFVANDGVVDSLPATVAITIEPVNDAPVADEQAVVTSEDTAVEIYLTGTDVEGSELTFSLETAPNHGTLSGTGASRLYTPDPGFEGEDTFTFIANDGELDSEPATVSITVNRTNEPPVADEQTVSTDEDVALGVTLTGSDPDGDPITYVISANPSHGTLSGTAPNLTYTPQENYYGPDSFRFIVNDGLVDSAEATISITIIPVNDAPVSEPQSVNVIEDTATTVTLSGSDIDGDNLTFMVETGPNHGNLSGTGQDLTYTPAANYNGSDSFTFKVNDGTVDSNIATVSITVTPVNDTPVANGQVVSTAEDTAKGIILTGTDVDGNPLTYSIITSPGHGTLSGSAPNVTYTPDANYNGSDSFTFGVSDGQANSAPATVSISISAVNDAPVAFAQTLTVDEDATLNVLLAGLDVDGDGLTFAVVTGPTHGNLSGTVPNLVYAPISNFNGSDTFTFTVSDGTLVSAPAAIEISIRPVNDLPVAEGQEVTTNENAPVTITLVGSDIDGDDLDYIIESALLFGGLTGTAPNLVYTPNEYYSGTDVFSFYVNDGISNSNSAEVTILILDINYLPIVYNQTVSTNENSPLAIILAGMDPDGDALNFFTKSLPAHGVLSGTAPNLVYTPNPGYTGSDSFTFAASDQEGESNEGVISIQVTPSGPLTVFFDDFETDLGWVRNAFGTDTASLGWFERANPESVSYYGDKQLGTTVSGSYDLVTGPLAGSSAGSYDLDGGKTSFLSPEIELPTGRDLEMSFSYYVAHYTNSSTADYLRVFIIGEDTVTIFEELGANNDDDAVWEVFSGDISNFAGQTIQLLIEAADASTASLFEAAVDDILILATTPNNPPVAEEQSYETAEDEDLEIILAGSDPNGDEISFRIESSPSHGSLSGTSPNLVYSPDSDYNGSDSFTYVVNDGKLDSEPATVFISVRAVNDAPIAIAQTLSTQVDVPVSIILSGTDAEGDNLTFSLITQPTNGILSGAAPDLVYTPAVGFTGTDSFQFTVNDGILASSPAVVSIEVNPAGPMTIFWDDFETDQGWVFDPFGTDTATVGTFERANPESVYYYGYKQLGTTVSGSYALVTGPLYGRSAGDYDLDGGVTMISSPIISLPTGREITLSFSYYFAHASNSSTSDYLRVKIIGSTTTTLFEELGASNDDDASWQTFSVSLNDFAGQTVYLLIEAADASTASLVEAAIDDVLIVAE